MKYGCHRVIEPKDVFPQPAQKLDNTPKAEDDEILVDVSTLNIDSASFHQIKENYEDIAKRIMEIVSERGKMHNPVTNSGGMLIGSIEEIGDKLKGKIKAKEGDRIASLVSLSLTPLYLEEIRAINGEQVDVKGKAILFESSIFAKIPADLDEKLVLSALDVAGAAPQVTRLAKKNDYVLILGGGKSGMLCACEARKRIGRKGKLIVVEYSKENVDYMKQLGYADHVLHADATNALDVLSHVEKLTNGRLCDLVVNCVNVPNTENTSIVCTRERGKVYFFSMATEFQRAALGAEGLGKDIDLFIGSGYCQDHADYTLNLIRKDKKLLELFTKLYGGKNEG